MVDFRTHSEKQRGWWIEERSGVPCILPKDGQLAVFRIEDVKILMDEKYPYEDIDGERHWYFNKTRDREIAETIGGRVYANPQVLWEHYLVKR